MRKVFAVAAALPAVVAVSPVQKVVQLLGELKAKVEADVATESKLMEEYTQYCDDDLKMTAFQIKTASSDIERAEAEIESSSGKISKYDAEIATATNEITGKTADLREATDIRNTESTDFTAAERELVDSVDMLARAVTVLKRELSFVQSGAKTQKQVMEKMGNMVTALGAIVSAAWVDPKAAKTVKAFIEQDDDLSLTQQPQAATYNYESKSGGIVDTLRDMQDKAEDQLAGLRKDETKKRHAFEMLAQSLNDAIKNRNETIEDLKGNKSASEQVKAEAEAALAKYSDSKAADEAKLATLRTNCASKAAEWATRQKTAADEVATLVKAQEILTSGVKSFAQVSVTAKTVKAADVADRHALIAHLRKMSRTYNSFQLMQIANRASSDPFVKVRGLVESMIATLEKQAQEEATHEAFCQDETKKSAAKRTKKEANVEKIQTRLDKANAAVATLSEGMSELNTEISEIEKMQAESTQLRAEEKAAFTVTQKDLKESITAVAKAIQVLSSFYGSASLMQQAPELGGSSNDQGSQIISFLEVAESDFTKGLAETESSESEAQTKYETMTQDNKVSKATKEAELKGKTSEKKAVEVSITDLKDDHSTESKELDAIMDYIEKLKPQCENKAMTYEERKARRESEISGLKTALDILSGEEVAVSFVQTKAFLAK